MKNEMTYSRNPGSAHTNICYRGGFRPWSVEG